jgi:hypothetical protein
MSAEIINFNPFLERKQYHQCNILVPQLESNSLHTSYMPWVDNTDFELDLSQLCSTLSTNSSEFKFPTIMSRYGKDKNPVAALYQYVQEGLCCATGKLSTYEWILDFFYDAEWLSSLLSALNKDVCRLRSLLCSYGKTHGKLIGDAKAAYNIMKDFENYIFIFSSVTAWREDVGYPPY